MKLNEISGTDLASNAKSIPASSAALSDFLRDCRASRTTAIRTWFNDAASFSTLQVHTETIRLTHSVTQAGRRPRDVIGHGTI